MPKQLEFISYGQVVRDPQKLVYAIRAKYPKFTDADVLAVSQAELSKPKHKPRLNHTCVYLFGLDIFADDLTTIEAWSDMDPKGQRYLQRHKTAGTLDRALSIDGLTKTYAFTKANRWVQEVADSDLERIRDSRASGWFRDYDLHGPWPGFPRMWELPVAERETFSDINEAARFADDVRRKKQWAGR